MLTLLLSGQSGLFDLYYDADLIDAHKIMQDNGFELMDTQKNVGEYRSETNIFVSYILLIADPKTDKLAGWLIKYSKENTAENDAFVLDTLAKMIGEKNHYDEETGQLVWFLTDVRTVHVMYGDDDALIVLFFDARFPELFKAVR